MSGDDDVLRFFARLANHEALRTHPERPRLASNVKTCPYCEVAQMFENMMVAQLRNATEEAQRQIARSLVEFSSSSLNTETPL